MNLSDWLSFLSLCVTVGAAPTGVLALRSSARSASAATITAIMQAISASWLRVGGGGELAEYEVLELFNLFELACATMLDGSMVGRQKEIMLLYTYDCLNILHGNDITLNMRNGAMKNGNTFKNIDEFRRIYSSRPIL